MHFQKKRWITGNQPQYIPFRSWSDMVLDPRNPAVEAWNSHQHWSMRRPPALQHQTLGLTNLSEDLGQGAQPGFPMGPLWAMGHSGAMMVFLPGPTWDVAHLLLHPVLTDPAAAFSGTDLAIGWVSVLVKILSTHFYPCLNYLLQISSNHPIFVHSKLSKLSSYWGTPHLLQPGWEESRLHFRMHAQPGLEGKTSMLGGDDFWYGGFHKWRYPKMDGL